MENKLSPTAYKVLERWRSQTDSSSRIISAEELTKCSVDELAAIKRMISDLVSPIKTDMYYIGLDRSLVYSSVILDILDRWKGQTFQDKHITACELVSCCKFDLLLLQLAASVSQSGFTLRCPGAGISFCEAHSRARVTELLEYFHRDTEE